MGKVHARVEYRHWHPLTGPGRGSGPDGLQPPRKAGVVQVASSSDVGLGLSGVGTGQLLVQVGRSVPVAAHVLERGGWRDVIDGVEDALRLHGDDASVGRGKLIESTGLGGIGGHNRHAQLGEDCGVRRVGLVNVKGTRVVVERAGHARNPGHRL